MGYLCSEEGLKWWRVDLRQWSMGASRLWKRKSMHFALRQGLQGPSKFIALAASVDALHSSTSSAQEATQTQFLELQDALSAEITARRRNAVRIAEAQAVTMESDREGMVQTVAGLRAHCVEVEERVTRLTTEVRNEVRNEVRSQLTEAQEEKNSHIVVGKLEESISGKLKIQFVRVSTDIERTWTKCVHRTDELEALVRVIKEQLKGAEEGARDAIVAVESRRKVQGQHTLDKLKALKSAQEEEREGREALSQALADKSEEFKKKLESLDRSHHNKLVRESESRQEVQGRTLDELEALKSAQEEEKERMQALSHDQEEEKEWREALSQSLIDKSAEFREQLESLDKSQNDEADNLHEDMRKLTLEMMSWREVQGQHTLDELEALKSAQEEEKERRQALSQSLIDKSAEFREQLESLSRSQNDKADTLYEDMRRWAERLSRRVEE
ncbi:unnamed protein product, partial [Choristocarpus tenellus]